MGITSSRELEEVKEVLKDGVPEVSTEQLINGLDGGTWETLKDAGFEQGDFLPLYTFNPNAEWSITFTSSSWTSDINLIRTDLVWDELFPSGVTTHILGQIRVGSIGAGETVDLRIQNHGDGETVGSITGITSTGMKTIEADYEPPTTGSRIDIRWEWQESPGTNGSEVRVPFISLGVKI